MMRRHSSIATIAASIALLAILIASCRTTDPTATDAGARDAAVDHRLGGYQPWGSSSGGTPGGSANNVQTNNGSGGFAGVTNVNAATDGNGHFISVSQFTDPVSHSGVLRLANNDDGIKARNAADSADHNLITSSGDGFRVGDTLTGAGGSSTVESGDRLTLTAYAAGSSRKVDLVSTGNVISPDLCATTTGNCAQTGSLRLSNNDGIYARNSGNSADIPLLFAPNTNNVYLGGDGTLTADSALVPTNNVYLGPIGAYYAIYQSTTTVNTNPVTGNSTVYGVHGGIVVTLDTNVTLSSSQYKFTRIAVSSTVTTTGNRNLVLPPPADPAGSDGYWKIISVNLSNGVSANVSMTSTSGAVVVNGAGTATTKSAVVWIDHAAGIIRITPDT